MLTFERVLNAFEDILQQDPLYEVVSTSHGYTLLAWDEHRNQWYSAELLETPEAMLDALLGVHSSYLESELPLMFFHLTIKVTILQYFQNAELCNTQKTESS